MSDIVGEIPGVHDYHWSPEKTRGLYLKLIGPMREIARQNGYALAIHGTLSRDIDIVACPWWSTVSSADTLVEELVTVVEQWNKGCAYVPHAPTKKPHGRRCWTIHLGGGPYIDLSVMPRRFE